MMTENNNEYHISLEWRSEESSSEDEHTLTDVRSSQLGVEVPSGATTDHDSIMVESTSSLSSPATSQTLSSRDLPSPSLSIQELPLPEGTVNPRGYQLELYRRACNENVIAFMDTGSGKTLVAALLVRKTLEDLKKAEQAEASNVNQKTTPLVQSCSNRSTDFEMTSNALPKGTATLGKLPRKHPREDPHDQLMVFTPKPLRRKARKIAVFLVHRVPLVPQQAAVVQSVLSSEEHVGAYHGERNVDDWSSSKWAKSLRSKSALVMTAQIFLNLLRHGLIDIRDVALLIIDEVHHATKGHPYRRIFIEFYHTIRDGDPRPRIFGMTATPVKRKSSYTDQAPYLAAIAELEATLDATVVAVSKEGQQEIETLVPKPEEYIVTFKGQECDIGEEEYGEEEVERDNNILSRLADLQAKTDQLQESPPRQNLDETDRSSSCKIGNGSASDEPMESNDTDVRKKACLAADDMEVVKRINRKLGFKAAVDFATQLCRIEDISPELTLLTLEEQNQKESSIPERVLKLMDSLFSEHLRIRSDFDTQKDSTPDAHRFHCIIFVQERSIAVALTWLINSVFAPLQCPELVARSVVGAQSSDSIVRMSRSNLCKTIDDFRNGKYGILVATSVVEEGLDIPACSLVVAFDHVMSPISYIQTRGRARKKGAHYISFVGEGNTVAYERLLRVRRGAKLMTEIAKSGIKAEVSQQLEEVKNLKSVIGKEKMLFSKTTGARVSATEALNLLHRYCYMKGNMDWETYKPNYSFPRCDDGFIATVSFHSSFPLDHAFSGEPCETQLQAKRHAALDAYTKLYQIGEVDAYLLPRRAVRSQRVIKMSKPCLDLSMRAFTHRSKQRPRREIVSKASKKNKRVRTCKVVHPRIAQILLEEECSADKKMVDAAAAAQAMELKESHVEEERMQVDTAVEDDGDEMLHLYRISLDCDMNDHEWYPKREHEVFGLLVRTQIPTADQRVIRCPQGDALFSLSFLTEICLTPRLERIAYKYVRFLQLCLRGRTPGSEGAVAIWKNDYDKHKTAGFFLVPLIKTSASLHFDVDWAHMQQLLTFGWRCGPAQEKDSSCEGEILEHKLICSHHESLDRVYLSGSKRPDLTADMHPRGYLNSTYESFTNYFEKKHGTVLNNPRQVLLEGFSVREAICNLSVSTFMLPLETCRVIPLSPLACFIATLLPAWQTFLALRSCWRRNSVRENTVGFLMFARALQPNINDVAKHEASLSYERLEFLGDAVLKVIYSMVTFVKNPDDSEGLLSDDRDLEVSNQRLADLALEMQLQHCVAFSGVSQNVKSWPWFWATNQNKPIRISEKVLADCVEALIGAQYLHGGVNLATEFMDKHNLLPGASDILQIRQPNTTSEVQEDGVSVDVPPMGVGDKRHEQPELHEVEKIIGYEFREKRHLVVALTHGSFENGLISSYQRYEYLGDAIIGFLLLSHYFKKYPDLSPGKLTTLRGPALSNDLFARVIVSCGLHRSFWHKCPPLEEEVRKFAELFANEENDDEDVSKTMTVPKVLADLLESIVGAIVVDKGMRLDGVLEIVLRVMDEELTRFANPNKFKHNPVSELVLLVQRTGRRKSIYEYLDEDEEGAQGKTCVISLEGDELGRGVGPTRRVAKRRASIAALRKLRSGSADMSGCASESGSLGCTVPDLGIAHKT